MRDEEKSREELITELRKLRKCIPGPENGPVLQPVFEARFWKILPELPLMIAYVNSAHRITFCSREYENRFGLPPGSLVGRRIEEVLLPPTLRKVSVKLKRAFAGEVANFETVLRSPNKKTERTFRITCIPHRGPDGDVGFFALGSDISEIRELEDRNRMEQELLNAKKLEAIGILAGGIAHDFNNLLFVILGNISMVQMKLRDDPVSRHLAEAEKACLRAKDLTQKFITFSSGGGPLKNLVSISNMVEDALSLILSGSNLVSDIDMPADLWKADIDEDQMRQALTGIFANAKEAMPRGGALRVRAENLEIPDKGPPYFLKHGRYVKLIIMDEGTGIPEENLDKIFNPYFSTKYRGSQKGMGFGLAITHSVIKRHNGRIKIESELGKGTRVTIVLPASTARDSLYTGPRLVSVGRKRVLVMDDEEMLGDLAKTMIEHLGYEAGIAMNGEEALEMYAESMEEGREWDVLILDLTVKGGMGGMETLQKLQYLNPEVKAIVSSGYSSDPIMSEYSRHGFRGILTKPYALEQLKEVLGGILQDDGPQNPVNA